MVLLFFRGRGPGKVGPHINLRRFSLVLAICNLISSSSKLFNRCLSFEIDQGRGSQTSRRLFSIKIFLSRPLIIIYFGHAGASFYNRLELFTKLGLQLVVVYTSLSPPLYLQQQHVILEFYTYFKIDINNKYKSMSNHK